MNEIPKKPWRFDDWFVALYGPRPCENNLELLRDRVRTEEIILVHNKALLSKLETWTDRRTAALASWRLKVGDKRDD